MAILAQAKVVIGSVVEMLFYSAMDIDPWALHGLDLEFGDSWVEIQGERAVAVPREVRNYTQLVRNIDWAAHGRARWTN